MDNKAQNSGASKNNFLSNSDVKSTLKTSKRTVRKSIKSGIQLKRHSIKRRIKAKEKEVKNEDSNKTKKLPVSKKRKLDTDCEEKPKKKKAKPVHTKPVAFSWTDEEYLAAKENLNRNTAKNIIELFDKNNTIPFIARYRCDLTGDLKPDRLRKIKATYEYIQSLHTKADQLVNQISSTQAVITPDLIEYIQTTQTLEELEFIGSQFKKISKTRLSERAKQLGLEAPGKEVLEGKVVNFEKLINPSVPGLEDVAKVKLGIQHIIADIISKNSDVHALLEKIYSSNQVLLQSKFKEAENETRKALSKYHLYGNFSQSLSTIRPHQTLAINRGESENELSVKIIIPDFLWLPLKAFCKDKWLKPGSQYGSLFNASVDDAIKRLLKPLVVRRIRGKLNFEAENEALQTFGSNLKQLLMTRPCSGHVVMGIDPGFTNGCKVAVVSATGSPIAHDKFFLTYTNEAKKKLKNLVFNHGCEIIALGNGTACRETENLLSHLINKKAFSPYNVSYTIVNEQGISIYSCSPAAEEEFPDLDPKIVSAISLARRLQNPLSELVKVEPKHLGVGLYQHDVGKKKLVSTLDDIVSECVSFVGVDVNTASFYLLKRVAGLSTSKAQEIIKYRSENCSFKSREDLKKVKGIKTVTFQQCAGFIRIIPSTARCAKHDFCQRDFNPLDETSIHPESYEAAIRIIKRFKLKLNQVGSEEFVDAVRKQMNLVSIEELAEHSGCSALSAAFIIDTITKPKNFDLRSLSPGPIFRKEIKKLEELLPGLILEGVVRNVVPFGAFVDVGVGHDGLIHSSQMKNHSLSLNEKVQVEVITTNLATSRIELKLLSVMK